MASIQFDPNIHQYTAEMLEKLASEYRGAIINSLVEVETLMEKIIAQYFCGNSHKSTELMHLFLSTEKAPFGMKKEFLWFIIENHYPNFHKQHPTLMSDLRDLMELRNKVAHRKFLPFNKLNKNFDGDTIYLEAWATDKNEIKTRNNCELSTEIVNGHKLKAKICCDKLDALLELIEKENP